MRHADNIFGQPDRTATTVDVDGDSMRMQITFFGLAPPACVGASCGDLKYQAQASGGAEGEGGSGMQLEANATYIRAGSKLGWSSDNFDNDDLEAERLFDFGILAPRLGKGAILSRRGYDVAYSAVNSESPCVSYRGYNWARSVPTSVSPVCQSHWSDWMSSSPDRATASWNASSGAAASYCSYSCTLGGMEVMMRETGVIDRLADATRLPADPMGDGIVEDGYTDPLDVMACCSGDYGAYARLTAGWIPSPERSHLEVTHFNANKGGLSSSTDFVLWPFDRGESRGKLKMITMRISPSQVLVLAFRSAPFWADVKLEGRESQNAGRMDTQDMRDNVAGLTVEYASRYVDNTGSMQWTSKGLLDFNLAFAEWPQAFPQAEVPIYNFSAKNLYSSSDNNFGSEKFERYDFSGYNSLQCMHLSVQAGSIQPQGKLDIKVRWSGLNPTGQIVLGTAKREGTSTCGFPVLPQLTVTWPQEADVVSVIWKDTLNRTHATDTPTVVLPSAVAHLTSASAIDATPCAEPCPKYTYFLPGRIVVHEEGQYYPVLHASSSSPQDLQGVNLVDEMEESFTLGMPPLQFSSNSLADSSTFPSSSPQVATLLWLGFDGQGPQLVARLDIEMNGGNVGLRLVWGDHYERRLNVSSILEDRMISGWQEGTAQKLSIQLVRADKQIGVWVLAAGRTTLLAIVGDWLVEDLYCIPSRPTITYCDHATSNNSSTMALQSIRLLGNELDGAGSWVAGTTLDYARMYNYAVPPADLAAETQCTLNGNCGSFYLQGWTHEAGSDSSAAPEASFVLLSNSTRGGVSGSPTEEEGQDSVSTESGVGQQLGYVQYSGVVAPGSPTLYCFVFVLQCTVPQQFWVLLAPLEGLHTCQCGFFGDTGQCGFGSRARANNKQAGAAGVESVMQQALPSLFEIPLVAEYVDELSVSATSLGDLIFDSSFPLTRSCHAVTPGRAGLSPPCQAGSGDLAPLSDPPSASFVGDESALNQDGFAQWTMGAWSRCTAACGGGTRHRQVYCRLGSGDKVDARLCTTSKGEAPAREYETSVPCNTNPCNLYVWQMSEWSKCGGSAPVGYAERSVTCINASLSVTCQPDADLAVPQHFCMPESTSGVQSSTHDVQPGTSDLSGEAAWVGLMEQPASSASCFHSPGGLALCQVAGLTSAPCFRHGKCSYSGCACQDGYHGQFCEIPSSCPQPGVLDINSHCCAAGVVGRDGRCCGADVAGNATLDGCGQCCLSGVVDACGLCDGPGVAVDVQGACCNTALDQGGTCCPSGAVDECGVCDGDSTSCAMDVMMYVHLQNMTQSPQQEQNQTTYWSQSLSQLVVDTLGCKPEHVILMLAVQATDVLQVSIRITYPTEAPDVTSGPQLQFSPFSFTLAAVLPALHSAIRASAKKEAAAEIQVLKAGGSRVLSQSGDGRSPGFGPGALAWSGVSIHLAERLGQCGNGVCEVGEVPWQAYVRSPPGPLGGPGYDAGDSCPMDCPLVYYSCPAPPRSARVGDATKECGGHGACLPGPGSYFGEDCGQCSPGFYANANGLCSLQLVNGLTVLDVAGQGDPIGKAPAPGSQAGKSTTAGMSGMALLGIGIGCAVAAIILLAVGGGWAFQRHRHKSKVHTMDIEALIALITLKSKVHTTDTEAFITLVQPGHKSKETWTGPGVTTPRHGTASPGSNTTVASTTDAHLWYTSGHSSAVAPATTPVRHRHRQAVNLQADSPGDGLASSSLLQGTPLSTGGMPRTAARRPLPHFEIETTEGGLASPPPMQGTGGLASPPRMYGPGDLASPSPMQGPGDLASPPQMYGPGDLASPPPKQGPGGLASSPLLHGTPMSSEYKSVASLGSQRKIHWGPHLTQDKIGSDLASSPLLLGTPSSTGGKPTSIKSNSLRHAFTRKVKTMGREDEVQRGKTVNNLMNRFDEHETVESRSRLQSGSGQDPDQQAAAVPHGLVLLSHLHHPLADSSNAVSVDPHPLIPFRITDSSGDGGRDTPHPLYHSLVDTTAGSAGGGGHAPPMHASTLVHPPGI
eukprot:gene3605-13688_t